MLQYITQVFGPFSHVDGAQIVLTGGCRWIQYRRKNASIDVMREECVRIKQMCQAYGATFIVNDSVELAMEVGADGAHLGKEDMPMREARTLVPEGFILGGTANTFEDMVALAESGADYIGLGPFRFTTTKQHLSTLLGIEGYVQRMQAFRAMGYKVPVVAIGGITIADVSTVMQSGVNGIAVSGAILQSIDAKEATMQFIEEIRQYDNNEIIWTID